MVGHEILAGQLLVEAEDRTRKLVPAAEATVASRGAQPAEPDEPEPA